MGITRSEGILIGEATIKPGSLSFACIWWRKIWIALLWIRPLKIYFRKILSKLEIFCQLKLYYHDIFVKVWRSNILIPIISRSLIIHISNWHVVHANENYEEIFVNINVPSYCKYWCYRNLSLGTYKTYYWMKNIW